MAGFDLESAVPLGGGANTPSPFAQPAEPSSNVFDLASAKPLEQMQTVQQAQGIAVANSSQSADAAGRAAAVGRQLGAPPAAVETDLPRYDAQAKAQQNANILAANPKLSNWVVDNPFAAKVAQDDFSAMGDIDNLVGSQLWGEAKPYISALGKEVAGGFNASSLFINRGIGGALGLVDNATAAINGPNLSSLITGQTTGTHLPDWWYEHMIAPALENRQALATPKDAPFGVKAVGAVGNMLSMLAQIAMTGGAGAAAEGEQALTTAGAVGQQVAHGARAMAFPALTSAVNTGKDVYDQTGDLHQAILAAQASYATTTLGGIVPLGATGGLATRLATGAVSGVATGEVSRQAMNLVMPQQEGFDPEQTILSGLSGAMLSGVMGRSALHEAVRQAYSDGIDAETAERGGAAIQSISELAAASKLRTHDPEAFRQYVASVAEDGPLEHVYVDGKTFADALHQSEVDPDNIPGLNDRLNEAVQTGGDVQIPIADYATHIAGTDLDKAIQPELKAEEGGMTYAEGQKFYADAATEMQARAEDLVKQQTEGPQADLQKISDTLHEQMMATGRYPADVARASLAPVTEFYRTMAERTGVEPGKLFEQFPLRIAGENPAEGALEQPARGGFAPDSNTIGLLKGADLSTFLHESGHFFLSTLGDLAGREGAPQQIKQDLDTFIRWSRPKEAPIAQFRRDAASIESSIPPAAEGFTRMWRGNRPGEEGTATTFTNDLAGIALPFRKSYEGRLTYVDIPNEDVAKYEQKTGAAEGAEFNLPPEVAAKVKTVENHEQTVEHRIAEWNSQSLEQQREMHEKFARGFEAYLMEGKSPTTEMQPLFARFRSWLINVYRNITGLGADLTPEVRGVFDRLLASDDAIQRAEMLRAYGPLDLSKSGLTEKQQADYQALGEKATSDAIDEMQERSLRDMKWASNAKSKALKRLQQEADEVRGMVRAEAEQEVRATPVEQARAYIAEMNLDLNPEAAAYKADRDQWQANRAESSDASMQAWIKANPEPSIIPQVSGKKPNAEDRARYNVERKEWAERRDAEAEQRQQQWDAANPKPEKPATPLDHWKTERAATEKQFADDVKSEYLAAPEAQGLAGLKKGQYLARNKREMANETERRMLEWEKQHPKPSSDTTRVPPDLVAEQFGFGSGKELTEALRAATPEEKIDALTDQRMLERHGELIDPAAVDAAANEAVHNEARARFMATGLKLLTKSSIPARDLVKAATEAAESAIAAKRVGDVKPRQYQVAESKANKEAIAQAPKDPAAAVQAQRQALLSNRLAKAAQDALAQIKKIVDYQKKYDKDSIRAKMDPDILEQIDALRERFDFRQKPPQGPTKAETSLQTWVDTQKAFGYAPVQHAGMMDPTVRMHYKDMTVEQLRGFNDTIRSMEQIARERKSITIEGRKVDLAEAVGELVDKMKERPDQFSMQQLVDRPRAGTDPFFKVALDRMASWLRASVAELKPQQFKANQFDRQQILGPFTRMIFDRVFNANYSKIDMLKTLANEFRDGAENLGNDWQKSLTELVPNQKLLDVDLTKETGETVYRRLTRGDMLGIARHVGNESNFDKLTKGMGWEPRDVWAFLSDSMTEKDWQATQMTWDAFEKHWPDMVEMNRRLGNVSPDRIEPRPFRTSSGVEMKGGYAPIDYDPIRSKLAIRKSDASAINPSEGLFGKGYFRADTTTNGSLNSRVASYYDRLDLDFHSIERRLHDTVHDLAYREALLDTHKILSNPEFRRQFQLTYGPEQYKSMQEWVGDLANGQNSDAQMSKLGQIMQSTRHMMVANGIALRVSTMIKHGGSAALKSSGYFTGGGMKYVTARAAQMATDHAGQIESAIEKFPEIRARAMQQDRDFRQTTASLFQPESFQSKAERFGHAGVAYLDLMSAVPTAWAAYDRAITEGIPKNRGGTGAPMSDEDAIEYANQIVREAHGSNIESARSAILQSKSEMTKMLTTMYGFMNNSLGQVMDTADKLKTAGFSKPEVLARFLMASIVPAIAAGVVEKQHKGEGWAEWAAKAITGEFAGMVPGIRDAWNAVKGYPDAGLSPLMRTLSAAGKPFMDAWKAAHGKTVKAPIKDIGNAIGLGIPGAGQVGTTLQYATDWATGKQQPQSVTDVARGLALGQGNK